MAEGETKGGESVPVEAVGDSEQKKPSLKQSENETKESGDGPLDAPPVKPPPLPAKSSVVTTKTSTVPEMLRPSVIRKPLSLKEKRASISSVNRHRMSTGSSAKLPDGSISSLKRKLLSVADGRQSVPIEFSGTMVERQDRSKLQMIKYMNSYRLESKHPFRREPVYNIIRDVFNSEFANVAYEPLQFAKTCTTVACEIRARVKALGFERYKLVCIVQICEKNRQSVNSIAKFLWDPERDNCTSYSYDSTNFLASGAVFGLYYE